MDPKAEDIAIQNEEIKEYLCGKTVAKWLELSFHLYIEYDPILMHLNVLSIPKSKEHQRESWAETCQFQ